MWRGQKGLIRNEEYEILRNYKWPLVLGCNAAIAIKVNREGNNWQIQALLKPSNTFNMTWQKCTAYKMFF